MQWLAVFKREMILLKQRMLKRGYVFASVFHPLIYLFAFGLGLGRYIEVEGGYGSFLCAGMAGVSVMTNSFQQTSVAVSVGRLYYKTFQNLMIAPIPPGQVAIGMMLAGMVRGIFAALTVYSIGALFFGGWRLSLLGFSGLVLGAAIFSALGIIVGMVIDGNENLSIIQNFIITPMIFFSGSFFPLKNLPWGLEYLVGVLPLGMINQLLHAKSFDTTYAIYLCSLFVMMVICWLWGRYTIQNYEE